MRFKPPEIRQRRIMPSMETQPARRHRRREAAVTTARPRRVPNMALNPPRATATLRVSLSRALTPWLLGWCQVARPARTRLPRPLNAWAASPSNRASAACGCTRPRSARAGRAAADRGPAARLARARPHCHHADAHGRGCAARRPAIASHTAAPLIPARALLSRLAAAAALVLRSASCGRKGRSNAPSGRCRCCYQRAPVRGVRAHLQPLADAARPGPGSTWPPPMGLAERLRALGVPPQRWRHGNPKPDAAPPAQAQALPPSQVAAGGRRQHAEATRPPGSTLARPATPPRRPARAAAPPAALLAPWRRTAAPRSPSRAAAPATPWNCRPPCCWPTPWASCTVRRHASLCFVGALAPVGGHNPLEPMALGQAFCSARTTNAPTLFDEAQAAGAGLAHDAATLERAVEALRDSPPGRRAAARARGSAHAARRRRGGDVDGRRRPVQLAAHGGDTLGHICAASKDRRAPPV